MAEDLVRFLDVVGALAVETGTLDWSHSPRWSSDCRIFWVRLSRPDSIFSKRLWTAGLLEGGTLLISLEN